MSEVEMLGLAGVGVIALYLLVRSFIGKGRDTDDADLVNVDGESNAE